MNLASLKSSEVQELLQLSEKLAVIKDFRKYATASLRIRTKAGSIEPLELNAAQRFLHQRLEDQLAKTGKVRALILKGRQQGCSTYVEGRFYWRTSRNRGVRAFILAHEQEASNNLFDIANRYHEHDPDKPVTKAANSKELDFAALDSGYRVATAGTKAAGRSQTIQYFHGSEVAFWPNDQDHMAGIMQAVPDVKGSEAILESTANGTGGVFHGMWQEAEAGQSEYQAIFIPWFWQEEYRKAAPSNLEMTDEEADYAASYGLNADQIYWRRTKIVELRDDILFKQEYPANAAEAFQVSGEDRYIPPELVLRARKAHHSANGPLILGVDPSRFGDDRFSIAHRKGRKITQIESRLKLDVVAGANWVKQVIDHANPAMVFVDAGGVGAGTIDILHSWGGRYKTLVKAVNFGGSPMEPEIILDDGSKKPGPLNRRAEMWSRSKEWLEQEGGADIPDSDSLQADACGPQYKYDIRQRLVLESKEQMRTRGIRSPDEWDAVALTFAEPVNPDNDKPIAYPKNTGIV